MALPVLQLGVLRAFGTCLVSLENTPNRLSNIHYIRRATVTDTKFPFRTDSLLKLTKKELADIIVSGKQQTGPGAMQKIWYPDGMIGFSHAVAQALNTLIEVPQLRMCEGLYLGFIAIEHKKDEKDMSDM